jgi:carbamoyltransferase
MNVLGINAYHADAAACLLRNGELVAAAEEERFRRIKHWAGFPSKATEYCLCEAGLSLADVDCIAINRNGRANLARKMAFVLRTRPNVQLMFRRFKSRTKLTGIKEDLARAFPRQRYEGPIEWVEHHFAHLASAFFASPFQAAAAASIDGFGDFASAAWGWGEGSRLSLDDRVLFPHSLGIFYQAMTQYLGFPNYGDEYKLMGLAAYGRPSLLKAVRPMIALQGDGTFKLDLKFFRHHREAIAFEWDNGAPVCAELFSRELESLLGPRRRPDEPLTNRHRDLAHATQVVFEEAFFHLLGFLADRYRSDALVLAGGCAYNSVANGKIRDRSPFKKTYVPSAAGDAGGAIGAACAVWYRDGRPRARPMCHAYWGPGYSDGELVSHVESNIEITSKAYEIHLCDTEATLFEAVARALADGQVVGWFQGRMEWGPRALGNRSILGDPRRADMKDMLNLKIKRRESFRPLAPSIQREAVKDWFEGDDDVPFMLKVLPIRPERQKDIPAVTHVNGTGRPQTVTADANPRYYGLIEVFHRLTGVPMVLNTSFNENEPVVCSPQEAIDCFLRTQMDMLVLGRLVIRRICGPYRTERQA